MSWQSVVERTVTGLGYDLVDAEKGVGGLLRVFIDHLQPDRLQGDHLQPDRLQGDHLQPDRLQGDHLPPSPAFITVDDCEKVTRQLQHVLEVEGCAYERLEVSSPGLDRRLKKAADYVRFAGAQVELTLKLPFKGRKKYRGELQPLGDAWRLVLADAAPKGTKKNPAEPAEGLDRALDFSLDEVREAHLVPVVDFKGRAFVAPQSAVAGGARPGDEIDGGRIQ